MTTPGSTRGSELLRSGVGGVQYQTARVRVPRHNTLVLYTDGLIESPAVKMSAGMTRLARPVTAITKLSVEQACDALLTTLAPHPADDVAILMARA